jgi:hypothetical protein
MHELRPGLLHESDFLDLAGLVTRLTEAHGGSPRDKVDEYVVSKLDDKTRWLVCSHRAGAEPSQTLKSALFEDLNRLLETKRF